MERIPRIRAGDASLPAIGFGTWQLTGRVCGDRVRDALVAGYRHIDTAQMYANEHEVGRGLRESGVDRGEVFLTTKLWIDNLARDAVLSSTDESLTRLQPDYLDLLLIHLFDGRRNPRILTGRPRDPLVLIRGETIGLDQLASRYIKTLLDLLPFLQSLCLIHAGVGGPEDGLYLPEGDHKSLDLLGRGGKGLGVLGEIPCWSNGRHDIGKTSGALFIDGIESIGLCFHLNRILCGDLLIGLIFVGASSGLQLSDWGRLRGTGQVDPRHDP